MSILLGAGNLDKVCGQISATWLEISELSNLDINPFILEDMSGLIGFSTLFSARLSTFRFSNCLTISLTGLGTGLTLSTVGGVSSGSVLHMLIIILSL